MKTVIPVEFGIKLEGLEDSQGKQFWGNQYNNLKHFIENCKSVKQSSYNIRMHYIYIIQMNELLLLLLLNHETNPIRIHYTLYTNE